MAVEGKTSLSNSKPLFKCYHRGFTALRLSQANASHGHECLLADRARGLPLADNRLSQEQPVQGDQLLSNEAITTKNKGKRSIAAIRKKRLKRNKKKKESNQRKKKRANDTIHHTVQRLTAEVTKLNEEQQKEKKLSTIYFNKYKAEEKKKLKLYRVPKNIDRKNLQTIHECEMDPFLGKGTFGSCSKRQYKGIDVAVKTYERNVRKTDVHWEASVVNRFDHTGLPLLFGVCLEKKPYLMVSQFYGIDGKCITLWKSGIIKSLQRWTRIFKEIADALLYVHNNSLLHNDIKGDNILLSEEHPVLIDFGKCRKLCNAKLYKLNDKEKERYFKEHCHLAPELINGTHCQTFASDVYSYGYLLRQCCKVSVTTLGIDNPLKLMSKKCLHKNPSDRPTLHDILYQL